MTTLTFPKIDGLTVEEVPAAPAAGASRPQVEPSQGVDVWDYFAENIDQFAVAKTIVDHFDQFPGALNSEERDLPGLYVRAKLTLKRRQIAYAEAQQAIQQAREQSRGVRGHLKAFSGFLRELRRAVVANPTTLMVAVLGVLMVLSRH